MVSHQVCYTALYICINKMVLQGMYKLAYLQTVNMKLMNNSIVIIVNCHQCNEFKGAGHEFKGAEHKFHSTQIPRQKILKAGTTCHTDKPDYYYGGSPSTGGGHSILGSGDCTR